MYGLFLTPGIVQAIAALIAGWWCVTRLDSPSVRGWTAVAWFVSGFILWYVAVMTVEIANWNAKKACKEAEQYEKFEEKFRKPEPVMPSGWTALAYETTTSYRTRALGLEGPKLRAVAAALVAGFPFSEDYLSDKAHLIETRECRTFKAKCLDRGLARWKDERHHTKGIEMTPERVEDTWKVLARGGLKTVGTPPLKTQITAPTR